MSWTLAELADLATRALAGTTAGAVNGRVTGVPDARMIRWYTTIGLLDRPELRGGRVARYGHRHLWQLVAVKRLQAQGLPLAEIQRRLTGATDETLRRLAAVPDELLTSGAAGHEAAPSHRVGAERGTGESVAGATPSRGERFWATRPDAVWLARPPVGRAPGPEKPPVRPAAQHRLFGLRLGAMTLLLPVEPEPEDWEAIAAAAGPLLDVLADRGLLDPTEGA